MKKRKNLLKRFHELNENKIFTYKITFYHGSLITGKRWKKKAKIFLECWITTVKKKSHKITTYIIIFPSNRKEGSLTECTVLKTNTNLHKSHGWDSYFRVSPTLNIMGILKGQTTFKIVHKLLPPNMSLYLCTLRN